MWKKLVFSGKIMVPQTEIFVFAGIKRVPTDVIVISGWINYQLLFPQYHFYDCEAL